MTATLTYRGALVANTCWCGIRHAIPQELYDNQHSQWEDGRTQRVIYCPLGHSYTIAGEGEAERLRRRLEQEEARRARTAAARDQAEASAWAYKGVATKARKRAAAALCPCCNRSFVQLRRHMEAKHPDFDPAAV